jgi:hypothetical protein
MFVPYLKELTFIKKTYSEQQETLFSQTNISCGECGVAGVERLNS